MPERVSVGKFGNSVWVASKARYKNLKKLYLVQYREPLPGSSTTLTDRDQTFWTFAAASAFAEGLGPGGRQKGY